jgi:hypothetical protein
MSYQADEPKVNYTSNIQLMLPTANVINLYSAVSRMKCANRQTDRGTISATHIPFVSLTFKKMHQYDTCMSRARDLCLSVYLKLYFTYFVRAVNT